MTVTQDGSVVPIVDLFAGPGGLGEGFSSLSGDPFQIAVSAEMEASAHQTLKLRAYYRLLRRNGIEALQPYYRFCNGESTVPYDSSTEAIWEKAAEEAQRLTLGNEEDNERLESILSGLDLGLRGPWVLIGGPPCQAYSLVGRSRNKGRDDYSPEEDHRHFLYREYLRIIQRFRPTVFVMENVKGILSASVGGQRIFHTILKDLADPDLAVGERKSRGGYRIHSLTCDAYFERSMSPDDIELRNFIVRAEEYGVPQARHRVILVGIRDDIEIAPTQLRRTHQTMGVYDAIRALPPLRSRLSKQEDSPEIWARIVNEHFAELMAAAEQRPEMADLRQVFHQYAGRVTSALGHGALRMSKEESTLIGGGLEDWYGDKMLSVWLNHESRSHMVSDLRRYAFAAAFARARHRSPSGHTEFNLVDALRPSHANWESGNFKDRFRVQLAGAPATTVTSHISKDGHYFIHPDPAQCRSLTVREAARLQTFPDNYFFQGNKTQQYHQVGNAVPPLLANKIAEVVQDVIVRSASMVKFA
ncbi:DNA (cytosine-5-)-methyltransferase [Limnobacter sp.]|uniref:DNA cytosine methyltransferase n=1 Tax=Limnobacter sp. TaxID=2003368 RepID=UPI0025C389FA|nr:DNA (cytosine-5-)-methyltransferase [Limnobacter sp.]